MIAAVLFPLAATVWWEHHADAVRQLNPLAQFLAAQNLRGFIFGTWALRLSPELWLQKWLTLAYGVTWWPVLLAALAIARLSSRFRRRQALAWGALFLVAPSVFPLLYGYHDYYFMANGILLLIALGFLVVGLAESESGRWGWLASVLVLAMAGAQAAGYADTYYEKQCGLEEGDNGLTQSLRSLVKPDEVIVIAGLDWNPLTPFFSQRRAMMLREEEFRDPVRLDAAFAGLAGEKIGALVLATYVRNPAEILKRSLPFGIETQPTYRWEEMVVYLRDDSREASVRHLQHHGYAGVTWIPGVQPNPERLAAAWVEVASLSPAQPDYFAGMNPKPVRFYSSFGPAIERDGGRLDFGAHPVTRLVFALPAGPHLLRTTVILPPDTYDPAQAPDLITDGVEITLTALARNGTGRALYTRLFNPRDNAADRGRCPLEIPFNLAQDGEVELFFGPGPAGRDTHDSISMGRMEIQ
jgi:hypothetical protein